jgi:hypothetical protein
MRLIPIPEHNLTAMSFAYPPHVDLELEAAVGVLGAKLGKLGFLKQAIMSVLCKRFTEPRRRMTALYVKPAKFFNTLAEFVAATVQLSVINIQFPATPCHEIVVHAQLRKVLSRSGAAPLDDAYCHLHAVGHGPGLAAL